MRSRRLLGAWALGGLLVPVVAACSGDDDIGDETTATLGSLATAPRGSATASATPGTDGGAEGAGYVRIQVRLGATGTDEVLELDRASVAPEDLVPVSLDARCTPLDGGGGFVVSVVDLRRVAEGDRLVSASLRIDGDAAEAGAYEGTIDVGDTGQTVTTYAGAVTLDAGLTSGSFDMADATGQAATGTFTCSDSAPAATAPTTTASTTTTIPLATS